MLKRILYAPLLIAQLLVTTPAFADAINYTGWSSIDLTSVLFSGISVTNLAGTSLTSGTDLLIDSVSRESLSSTLSGEKQFQSTSLQFQTLIDQVPGGTGISSASSDALFASQNLIRTATGGHVVSALSGEFRAVQTGDLTFSAKYSLTTTGIPNVPFNSLVTASLILNDLHSSEDSLANSNSSRSGTLSATRRFNAGETSTFALIASVSARTVPEPDMLLPTLSVMLGIAVWHNLRILWSVIGGSSNGCSGS
jgi:hypothetical protein